MHECINDFILDEGAHDACRGMFCQGHGQCGLEPSEEFTCVCDQHYYKNDCSSYYGENFIGIKSTNDSFDMSSLHVYSGTYNSPQIDQLLYVYLQLAIVLR